MRFLLEYAFRSLWRNAARTASFSLSTCAAAFFLFGALGSAASIDDQVQNALQCVLNDAQVWIVPPGGLFQDPQSGFILPRGRLTSRFLDSISHFVPETRHSLNRVLVRKMTVGDGAVNVYSDSNSSDSRILLSRDLEKEQSNIELAIRSVCSTNLKTILSDKLPRRTVEVSRIVAERLLNTHDSSTWLLLHVPNAKLVATD